jgi:hypothetical protein
MLVDIEARSVSRNMRVRGVPGLSPQSPGMQTSGGSEAVTTVASCASRGLKQRRSRYCSATLPGREHHLPVSVHAHVDRNGNRADYAGVDRRKRSCRTSTILRPCRLGGVDNAEQVRECFCARVFTNCTCDVRVNASRTHSAAAVVRDPLTDALARKRVRHSTARARVRLHTTSVCAHDENGARHCNHAVPVLLKRIAAPYADAFRDVTVNTFQERLAQRLVFAMVLRL